MDPEDPRRARMPYIDDQLDEYTAALFFRFMGSQAQQPGTLVAFKYKRAIPKFLRFEKIDSKEFEHLKTSPALLFLNLF